MFLIIRIFWCTLCAAEDDVYEEALEEDDARVSARAEVPGRVRRKGGAAKMEGCMQMVSTLVGISSYVSGTLRFCLLPVLWGVV